MQELNINNSLLVTKYSEVTKQIIELEEQIKKLTSQRQELIKEGIPLVFECRTGYQTYKDEFEYDDFKYIICLKTKPPIKSVVEGIDGIFATVIYQDGSREVIEHTGTGFLGWGDNEKEAWLKASRNLYHHDQVNKYLGWPLD